MSRGRAGGPSIILRTGPVNSSQDRVGVRHLTPRASYGNAYTYAVSCSVMSGPVKQGSAMGMDGDPPSVRSETSCKATPPASASETNGRQRREPSFNTSSGRDRSTPRGLQLVSALASRKPTGQSDTSCIRPLCHERSRDAGQYSVHGWRCATREAEASCKAVPRRCQVRTPRCVIASCAASRGAAWQSRHPARCGPRLPRHFVPRNDSQERRETAWGMEKNRGASSWRKEPPARGPV